MTSSEVHLDFIWCTRGRLKRLLTLWNVDDNEDPRELPDIRVELEAEDGLGRPDLAKLDVAMESSVLPTRS